MKLLKQRLINYLNYTNIHKYSSDTKTKKRPKQGCFLHLSSIFYLPNSSKKPCFFKISRYRLTASVHKGNGLKPFSTNLLLFKRELNGRTALDKPYSAVVTGVTLVS